jgi:glycosyltransferase involved in cell wall biosynthesis
MSRPLVSIVVPTRAHEAVTLTMDSLMKQTVQDFELHLVVDKDGRGAPWARNRGAELARGEYLLFSDADICWDPDALEAMVTRLGARRDDGEYATAYVYGSYEIRGPGSKRLGPIGTSPWDLAELSGHNYISTMSLMVREAFMGWDETLTRLQDWEMWLRMAKDGKLKGEYLGRGLFWTPWREHGISFEGDASYTAAWRTIRMKHRLPV